MDLKAEISSKRQERNAQTASETELKKARLGRFKNKTFFQIYQELHQKAASELKSK